jgi:hypothetical protein
MAIRVTTRHGEDFDILTEMIEPKKSPYAETVNGYVEKIANFYALLGVKSAMWTAAWVPEAFEFQKPVEYLLELSEDRVIAYVDEQTWSPYLFGQRIDFQYSRAPARYAMTSVLVAPPIKRDEIKAIRRYSCTNTGHCKLEDAKSGTELQQWLNRACRTTVLAPPR